MLGATSSTSIRHHRRLQLHIHLDRDSFWQRTHVVMWCAGAARIQPQWHTPLCWCWCWCWHGWCRCWHIPAAGSGQQGGTRCSRRRSGKQRQPAGWSACTLAILARLCLQVCRRYNRGLSCAHSTCLQCEVDCSQYSCNNKRPSKLFPLVSCVFLQPHIQSCWDRLSQLMHVVVGVQELRAASLGGATSSASAGAGSGGAAADAAVQEAAVNTAAPTAAAAGDRQGGSSSQQVGPPVHQPCFPSAHVPSMLHVTLRMLYLFCNPCSHNQLRSRVECTS
jgi:hypothetical protein